MTKPSGAGRQRAPKGSVVYRLPLGLQARHVEALQRLEECLTKDTLPPPLAALRDELKGVYPANSTGAMLLALEACAAVCGWVPPSPESGKP